MSMWQGVVDYVRAHYKISDEQPGMLKLIFETSNLRTQVVILSRQATQARPDDEWLQIESPIGEVANVDLNAALTAVGDTVCGGLSMVGTVVTFRHAVPLSNININELEQPLAMVTTTADRLERQLTGGDQF
jgi:hypothetical protein